MSYIFFNQEVTSSLQQSLFTQPLSLAPHKSLAHISSNKPSFQSKCRTPLTASCMINNVNGKGAGPISL